MSGVQRIGPLALGALLLIALTVSACGNKEQPEVKNDQARQVAATIQGYINAQQSGDWQEMCTLLDNPSRRALQRNKKLPSVSACAQALSSAPAKAQAGLRESATGVRVIKAAVQGNKGEALVKVSTGRKIAKANKIDGVWRVSITE